MAVTVYYATNRVLSGPGDRLASYGESVVAPSDPGAVTYGTAFADDADLTADTTGAITALQDVETGRFSQQAAGDLSAPGRDLLVFIHGFDNSFENAITRAAFNQQWLAASGIAGADTTVVAFSWPSRGKLIGIPFPDYFYRQDQTKAGQSALHLMSFFAHLQPLIAAARARGSRVHLLAHSMGNWALQAAVESWFAHGNGDANLFDEAILAAADEVFTTFDFPPDGRLTALRRLARRISIFYSGRDEVLKISKLLNAGAQRLGEDGPDGRADPARFPPGTYRMVDCTGFQDYDFDLASSHQYYRRSPGVRAAIASTFA
jgi:esterase/lipase superfamily enzyme